VRTLTLYPAIDLRGGHAVRLERGDPSRETRYDADPVARARAFVADGAQALHVVDLDGAFGTGENQRALREICAAVDVPVQTGGGIRSADDVAARFAAGASAVVIGTLLVEHPNDARVIADRWGDRIVAGIDARGERVATRGWLAETAISRDDLVRTVAVAPTLDNVLVLGLIVLIRTVLSFSLETEIEGVAPWRRAQMSGVGGIRQATARALRPGPGPTASSPEVP